MAVRIREVYSNVMEVETPDGFEDKSYVFGETDWHKPATEKRGELFRSYRRQYGNCKSLIQKDVMIAIAFYPPVKRTVFNGWYFEKRRKYQDSNDMYIQGTFVIVEGMDE